MKKRSCIRYALIFLGIIGLSLIVGAVRDVVTSGSGQMYQLLIHTMAVGLYRSDLQSMQFYMGGTANRTINELDGTLVFQGDATVWDDMRIIPSGMDRVGVADPTLVQMATNIYAWEFQKNDEAYFSIQIPHKYKAGSDMYVHIHWSPGANGNEESGKTVGWKVDYAITSIGSAFGSTTLADLSHAVTGVDQQHEITSDVTVSGSGVGISAIIIGRISRTDTGTDDTWSGTASGSLPLLLELDFHYEMDTVGSRTHISK